MKNLFFFLLISPIVTSGQSKYICSTIINNDKFIINYCDDNQEKTSTSECLIKNDNGKQCFVLDADTIYIDVDTSATYLGDMRNEIVEEQNFPYSSPGYQPVIFYIFILDKKGNIIQKGLNRQMPFLDEYQLEFFRILKSINGGFIPAVVNGENVGSIFFFTMPLR